nr:retrovirus-related Pol polyprotein from transposon TNT 1-94 [Tanacetum cinerariifolium]
MSTPTFAKTHNLIAYLEKPTKISLTIHTSCIKQFWTSARVKKVNDEVRIQALVDGKRVSIKESLITRILRFDDVEGISCLTNTEIFEGLARMGAKTTSWNEFSSTMAYAIICLATNQKFNFSRYILLSLVKNIEAGVPFFMFSSGEDSLKLKELMDLYTNLSNKVLDLESEVLDIKSTYKAKIEKLESRVKRLEEENRVSKELKAEAYNLDLDHQEKVLSMLDVNDEEPDGVKEVVEVFTAAKLITEVVTTAGVDVNAASVQDTPIIATKATKVIVKVPKPRKRKGVIIQDPEETTTTVTVQPKVQEKDKGKAILIDEPNLLKRQVQIDLDEEVRKPLTEAQTKRNMIVYLKNMAGYKMNYFKGMNYDEIRPIFEKHYNYNQAFLNEVNEGIKVPEKEVRQEKEVKVESSKREGKSLEQEIEKKQKMDQETKELKKHLQIVPDDDDDDVYTDATPLASKIPIVDYQNHTERNRPYFKIIRADENHKLFMIFKTMMKNFDREDLESLWKIIKERFEKTEPKNYRDDYLLNTLKILFKKPNVEANVWKDQKGKYGLSKDKSWKLFDSCRVHCLNVSTTQIFLLVEKMYPLTHFTLEQMVNDVRLEVYDEKPKNIIEALRYESWIVAMQEELNQFIAKDVWELVPQPRNMKIIGTKWLVRNNLGENGVVSRNKARLLAQGYNQQEGIDYDETYAPVARLESIWILLAYAYALDFKLFQMDITSEFLNDFINEEVYMAQPLGFVDFEKPDHVYKQKKALYGLKQAPKSWPDIMFSVCLCARFQEAPKTSHLEVVKRIFRYIKGTTHLGLRYPKGTDIETVVYADSDHAGDYMDRKITSSICTFMECCLTSWFSKKQTVLAISTTEAEYVSAKKACQQALWMKQALIDYDVRLNDVSIMCDNKGAIDLSKNPMQHSRTKHIEIRHHFLCDNVQKGHISIKEVSSVENIVDILTKPLKCELTIALVKANQHMFVEGNLALTVEGELTKFLASQINKFLCNANYQVSLQENKVTRTKKNVELSAAEKIQADCDMKATNIILQGTSLTKPERECKLYDAFDKFTHIKGESLHKYYLRFTQLINDMNIYNMKMKQFQVNTKFLSSLLYEWSKFVTDVKLVKDLHTINFDQLHAYLEQHELHVNEVYLLRERNQDLLAFVAIQQLTPPHFNTYQSSITILNFNNNNNRDDLIACLNKEMTFLTAIASSRFPSINNQLRTSSNLRNHATIQDGRVTAQQVQGRQATKEKEMLAEAHEARQILDEEQFAFFVDPGVLDCQAVQTIIPNNAAFQTEDFDTYDSDCDDISNEKTIPMANISNYGSYII